LKKLSGWSRILVLLTSVYYITSFIWIILGTIILDEEVTEVDYKIRDFPIYRYTETDKLYKSAQLIRQDAINSCVSIEKKRQVNSVKNYIKQLEDELENTKAIILQTELEISDKDSLDISATREQYDVKEYKLKVKITERNLADYRTNLKTYSVEPWSQQAVYSLNILCDEYNSKKSYYDIWYLKLKINYSLFICVLILPFISLLVGYIFICLIKWIMEGFKAD
jgi:hypothetical protein